MNREEKQAVVSPVRRWHDLLKPDGALLLFVWINALAQWGIYWRHGQTLAERAGQGGAEGMGYFALYTGALMGCLASALGFLGVAERWWRRSRRWYVTTVFIVCAEWLFLLLLVIDTQVFEMLGVHLYQAAVLEALQNEGIEKDLQISARTLWSLGGFAFFAATAEVGLYRLCLRASRRLSSVKLGLQWGLVGAAVVAMGLTVALRPDTSSGGLIAQAMPLFDELVAETRPQFIAEDINYPRDDAPKIIPLHASNPPDILWIQVESLRADHVNEALTPRIIRFAEDPKNHCLTASRHYASAQTTERATFSLLYGLDGYQYEAFATREFASYPMMLLQRMGYQLLGASASSLQNFRGAGFIVDMFDEYEEYLDSVRGYDDQKLVEYAIEKIKNGVSDPEFIFLFFYTTHHNYFYPPGYEKFTPVLPLTYDHMGGDSAAPEEQLKIHNRYRNSVTYLDALFGELMGAVGDRIDRGELIVVFTGDHGEEFWEHGLLGHSAPRFIEERGRVPLLICLPGEASRRVPFSSHIDVWPTLLDHLSPAPPLPESYGQGRSLLRASSGHARFITGLDFPLDNPTACLVDEEHKFWIELCPGDEFCLQPFRVTDSNDQSLPLNTGREKLSRYLETLHRQRKQFVEWIIKE